MALSKKEMKEFDRLKKKVKIRPFNREAYIALFKLRKKLMEG